MRIWTRPLALQSLSLFLYNHLTMPPPLVLRIPAVYESPCRRGRRAGMPPSALEVRQEIERRLQPARVYRATWRVEPGPQAIPL